MVSITTPEAALSVSVLFSPLYFSKHPHLPHLYNLNGSTSSSTISSYIFFQTLTVTVSSAVTCFHSTNWI